MPEEQKTALELIDELVSDVGGVEKLGAVLGVTHQAVSAWRKRGHVPIQRAVHIEALYGIPATSLVRPEIAGIFGSKAAT